MAEAEIRERLPKIWASLLLRGITPILIGTAMLFLPSEPASFYALLFGAYVFIDGILLLAQTFIMGIADSKRWSRTLHGMIGVLVGLAMFFIPEISHMRLVTLFSGYEITTGLLQVLTAFDLRKMSDNNDLVAIGGIISIVVGGLLSIRPMDTLSDLVRAIGIFLMVRGSIL